MEKRILYDDKFTLNNSSTVSLSYVERGDISINFKYDLPGERPKVFFFDSLRDLIKFSTCVNDFTEKVWKELETKANHDTKNNTRTR